MIAASALETPENPRRFDLTSNVQQLRLHPHKFKLSVCRVVIVFDSHPQVSCDEGQYSPLQPHSGNGATGSLRVIQNRRWSPRRRAARSRLLCAPLPHLFFRDIKLILTILQLLPTFFAPLRTGNLYCQCRCIPTISGPAACRTAPPNRYPENNGPHPSVAAG